MFFQLMKHYGSHWVPNASPFFDVATFPLKSYKCCYRKPKTKTQRSSRLCSSHYQFQIAGLFSFSTRFDDKGKTGMRIKKILENVIDSTPSNITRVSLSLVLNHEFSYFYFNIFRYFIVIIHHYPFDST